MYIIRPVKMSDLESLKQFAKLAGTGMTHLMAEEDLLAARLHASVAAFSNPPSALKQEEYFFVLADSTDDAPHGVCAISASAGSVDPLELFAVEEMPPLSPRVPPLEERRVLQLRRYTYGPTEICALFLSLKMRSGGWGKLLSWCRFLFIAAFPERFQTVCMANMRGSIIDNRSIFWDRLGRHFLNMDFAEMMQFRLSRRLEASEIFPSFPIPVTLLDKEAREAIGQVFVQSRPAMAMLEMEGFRYAHEIDPYDGGPIIKAKREEILAVRNSVRAIVGKVTAEEAVKGHVILSNEKLDFRACYGEVEEIAGGKVSIAEEVAQKLQVSVGDPIRYLRL